MSINHEDEFVAVRVQDPRVQNEGSWNSYVDYKIFLHTNSKAFTAKTSCVRRRYSEFVWLKKRMQKNAGLVPVPDLPGKSFFSFGNEDFLERRRHGLQVFLDRVVHMTVCLSDSQLHLFLQTQLPVGHILDCVQGHTPYTVTDAILTYASSNLGWAQAQEEDAAVKEQSLSVPYESMESPAPHQPRPQGMQAFSAVGRDPLVEVLEPRDATARKCKKALLPADDGPADATFYLEDSRHERTLDYTPEDTPRSGPMETPVEVHSPAAAGFEDGALLEEEPTTTWESCEHADHVAAGDKVRSHDSAKEEHHEDFHVRRDDDYSPLSSSNESIVKVSDEEQVGDDATDPIRPPNGFVKMSPVAGRTPVHLHVNGCGEEDELSNSLDVENNDFSVLESSAAPQPADTRHSQAGTPSSSAAHATDQTAGDI
ncbi:sorting nexin-11 [Nerophis ophidion]|uniref:sorting nexin-11 n=1 Tax=Nerophis ophidion TaxID=159077 RepID=UPI002ADFCC9C|nr:sorting nexin-11 [Nerophis ophidion]XP_061764115.1 sorting nexin-11 [Nerophis ophidion]